jgi:hypothetical protein
MSDGSAESKLQTPMPPAIFDRSVITSLSKQIWWEEEREQLWEAMTEVERLELRAFAHWTTAQFAQWRARGRDWTARQLGWWWSHDVDLTSDEERGHLEDRRLNE